MKSLKNRVRLDAITTGTPINRYLTLWHTKRYDDSGEIGKERLVSEKRGFCIEWKNLERDTRAVLKNPLHLPKVAPQLAYTFAALALYLKGDILSASAIAFTGAVAYDADSTVGGDTSATTRTVAHTATGSNRVAVLVAAKTYTATFSNAIHDSTGASNAMTEAGQTSLTDKSNVGIFYYANPSTSSVTYSCTSSAADYWGFAVYTFTGASGTVNGFQQSWESDFDASVTITSASGNMIVGGAADDAGQALTGGAGQTQVSLGPTGNKVVASYEAATGASMVHNYTWGTSGNTTVAAVNVVAAPVASVSPSASPSVSPSASPSVSPSVSPSASPSISPSISPSVSPSISPSISPSSSPSQSPSSSVSPSISPSQSPSSSVSPSISPSVSPSMSPSSSFSISPSASPSVSPSNSPSQSPSSSVSPSASPSISPSKSPSQSPSSSVSPSQSPSQSPSSSISPSNSPSQSPSASVSPSPSPATWTYEDEHTNPTWTYEDTNLE